MSKVVKKYETYVTVVKIAKFVIMGILVASGVIGILNGGDVAIGKF